MMFPARKWFEGFLLKPYAASPARQKMQVLVAGPKNDR